MNFRVFHILKIKNLKITGIQPNHRITNNRFFHKTLFTFGIRVPSMSTTLNKLFYLTRKQLTCIDPNLAFTENG